MQGILAFIKNEDGSLMCVEHDVFKPSWEDFAPKFGAEPTIEFHVPYLQPYLRWMPLQVNGLSSICNYRWQSSLHDYLEGKGLSETYMHFGSVKESHRHSITVTGVIEGEFTITPSFLGSQLAAFSYDGGLVFGHSKNTFCIVTERNPRPPTDEGKIGYVPKPQEKDPLSSPTP